MMSEIVPVNAFFPTNSSIRTYYNNTTADATAVAGLTEEEAWVWALIFLLILCPTAVAMIAEAWLFYSHVEITHPMYAVLMQECLALTIISWCIIGSLLTAFWAPEITIPSFGILMTLGIQLHKASWLVITILR